MSLRDVDWKNIDMVPGLDHLRDGFGELREYSDEPGGLHDTTSWRFVSVSFGDFDNDGSDEAALLVEESYSPPNGAGSSTHKLYLFTEKNGKRTRLGSIYEAESIKGVVIADGALQVHTPEGCVVLELDDEANWAIADGLDC